MSIRVVDDFWMRGPRTAWVAIQYPASVTDQPDLLLLLQELARCEQTGEVGEAPKQASTAENATSVTELGCYGQCVLEAPATELLAPPLEGPGRTTPRPTKRVRQLLAFMLPTEAGHCRR